MSYKVNEKLIFNLKVDEGFCSNLYLCTEGKRTIGYGRNVEGMPDNEIADLKTHGISLITAEAWLEEDIAVAIEAFHKIFTSPIENLTENRFNGIVNMIYNLGETRFRLFKKTIKAIKAGNWELASSEALDSKWSRVQVPNRSLRISKDILDG